MLKVPSATARFGLAALASVAIGFAQNSSTSGSEPVKLEKFEVTGSNIKRVDVEGPSPIKIITHMVVRLAAAPSALAS